MDKEKETVWTSDMGFMPPIPKTEGRTICREECQLTEYKQEIERLRKESRLYWDAFQKAANEIERLREALRKIGQSDTCGCQGECDNMQEIACVALKEGE